MFSHFRNILSSEAVNSNAAAAAIGTESRLQTIEESDRLIELTQDEPNSVRNPSPSPTTRRSMDHRRIIGSIGGSKIARLAAAATATNRL
jgi:hypothetical protein